jgi:beta-glucosidase
VAVVFASQAVGEGMDRASLDLPGDQDRLIAAVAEANPRTVVVLNTGGPVLMPWLDRVGAVLQAWLPGQQFGEAVAAVLFGDADPGGRLPVTFPATGDQGPITGPDRWPGVDGDARYDEGVSSATAGSTSTARSPGSASATGCPTATTSTASPTSPTTR